MAKTQTKATTKAAKSRTSAKAARKRHLETHLERNGAHAYAERWPIMADQIADDGPATGKELFKALRTSPTGLFATQRRVDAAFRADQRQDTPMFERVGGGLIQLRKRTRQTAGSKRQKSNGKVSTRRTRKAS